MIRDAFFMVQNFGRITIIGLGLIGGSWALALKKRGYRGTVVGCGRRQEVLDHALAARAIDEATQDFTVAVRRADLVILAPAVGAILDLLPRLKPALRQQALVTDVGSTKVAICDKARAVFGGAPRFLGGHPMAGKERSGFENADPDLFEGARYILTPENEASLQDPGVAHFMDLVRSVGGRPLVTDAASHDRAVAWLSHLPQVLSTALASLIAEEGSRSMLPLELSATGLRDMTRLAESPYPVWRDILATNQDNIRSALDSLIEKLQFLKEQLGEEALASEFRRASELRESLRKRPR